MGHTPYGYSIENGCATINEDEAEKIRKLYENYISGMALAKAAAAAGIETYHGTAKRLRNCRKITLPFKALDTIVPGIACCAGFHVNPCEIFI